MSLDALIRSIQPIDENARAAARDRTPAQLIEAMVGRGAVGSLEPPEPPSRNVPKLQVPKLQVRDLSAVVQERCIRNVAFELAAGEILGVAGVSGNGQFELAEILAGLVPVSSGDIGELVGDQHHCLALGGKAPDESVEPLGLGRRQHRGRLVEDDQSCL